MKYFAALDVSDKETWVCVVDHEGTILKEGPENRLVRIGGFSPLGLWQVRRGTGGVSILRNLLRLGLGRHLYSANGG